MAESQRIFEGSKTVEEQQIPQRMVEALMNAVWNMRSTVLVDSQKKMKRSNVWTEFVSTYLNLVSRTSNVIDDYEKYLITINTPADEACEKVFNYLDKLQEQGFFVVGREEVLFNDR